MRRAVKLGAACVVALLSAAEPALAVADPEQIGESIQTWFAGIGQWVVVLMLGGIGIGAIGRQKWGLLASVFGIGLVVMVFLKRPQDVIDLLTDFANQIV